MRKAKGIKAVMSLMLTTAMLVGMLCVGSVTVSAAVTSAQVKAMLDTRIASVYVPGTAPPSSSYRSGTSGCFGFVDLLCREIFGHNLASQKSAMQLNSSSNFTQIGSTLSQSAGTLSTTTLSNLFANAVVGDVVQMDYTTYSGGDSRHTMMVYSVSATGVVFYHAGSSKVYYGQSNGTQPLWGTTGNVLTWANLLNCLRSSDDGISLYRSANLTTHTCSYTQYYESAHPHNGYMQCSCGAMYYTDTNNIRWSGSGYDAAHPHSAYRTCWCGHVEYTGGTQTLSTCVSCIDAAFSQRMEYNGNTYDLYLITTTWDTAKAYCESKGGYLVTVTYAEEWNAVRNLIDGRYVWLGGYLDTDSVWRWVTGEDFAYTPWCTNEPSGGTETYLGSYVDDGWNDFNSDDAVVAGFVCEYGPVYKRGDVNGDGIVAIADAMQAFYHVSGRISLDEEQQTRADVAAPDAEISIGDAMKIFYYVSGRITAL